MKKRNSSGLQVCKKAFEEEEAADDPVQLLGELEL